MNQRKLKATIKRNVKKLFKKSCFEDAVEYIASEMVEDKVKLNALSDAINKAHKVLGKAPSYL